MRDSLPGLFEARVAEAGDAVALVSDEQVLTRGELNAWANRLAHRLSALGVGVEDAVGVLVRRSAATVVASIAAVKVGGYYVPVPDGFAVDWLRRMVSDTGLRVVVVDRETASHPAARELESAGVRLVPVEAGADLPAGNPGRPVQPGQPAYLMYTSGSRAAGSCCTPRTGSTRRLWRSGRRCCWAA